MNICLIRHFNAINDCLGYVKGAHCIIEKGVHKGIYGKVNCWILCCKIVLFHKFSLEIALSIECGEVPSNSF